MKQRIYIYALIDLIIITTGAIFKVEHWPGAGIMLMLGLAAMVVFVLPLMLISNYRNTENAGSPLLHITLWITCAVVFTAMLFKIQHWPGAGIALLIALPFPYLVFLPVYLVTTSKKPVHNIYNTVLVLMLLAVNSVFSGLLALNVTALKITDSYNISGDYKRVELALGNLSAVNSDVSQRIDDVLASIDKYRTAILSYEGLSDSQWNSEPASLFRPDSRTAAYDALKKAGYLDDGNELEKNLKAMLEAFKADPRLSDLNDAALSIIGFEPEENKVYYPVVAGITYNNPLSWMLTWFDALETNLRLIKVSL